MWTHRVLIAALALLLLGALTVTRLSSLDPMLQASQGIGGFQSVHKFGRNPDVDTASVPEDIWPCPTLAAGVPELYPWQAAAYTLWASSDDENDAGLAFTVEGLGNDWKLQTVTQNLGADTGTGGTVMAQVGVTLGWLRVFRVYNASDTDFVGNLWLNPDDTDAGGDGVPDDLTGLQACVTIGNNQTLMALYTIPDGYTGFMRNICFGVNATNVAALESAVLQLYARTEGGVFRAQEPTALRSDGSGHFCRPFDPPVRYPEHTDLRVEVPDVASNNTVGIATFDIVLVSD